MDVRFTPERDSTVNDKQETLHRGLHASEQIHDCTISNLFSLLSSFSFNLLSHFSPLSDFYSLSHFNPIPFEGSLGCIIYLLLPHDHQFPLILQLFSSWWPFPSL